MTKNNFNDPFQLCDIVRVANHHFRLFRLFLLLLLNGFTIAMLNVGMADEVMKPNIVFIVSDDQGWRDIGYRNSQISTPHLDRLAKQGVKLEHHYVFPTCSPTRCAILSGRNPASFGILGPIGGESTQAMPRDIPNLATMLKSRGYVTALAGKWHLNLNIAQGPKHYGFDMSYGYLHGQIDPLLHDYKTGKRTWHRDDVFVDETGHATDLIADEAVRVINQHRNQPFFLYVAFSVPHEPIIEEEKWTSMVDSGIVEPTRRLVCASISHMDDAIGRIAAAIDKANIRDNTIIVFTSDNGGPKMADGEDYDGRFKDQRGPHSDNGPLRGWKGDTYEGGVLVPAFITWPAKLNSRTETAVVSALDWLPTFAAITGYEISRERALDGKNILPVLTGEAKGPDRTLFWRTSKQFAVRDGAWKLVDAKDSKPQLFRLDTDPYEKEDLGSIEQDQASRLSKKLNQWKDTLPEKTK